MIKFITLLVAFIYITIAPTLGASTRTTKNTPTERVYFLEDRITLTGYRHIIRDLNRSRQSSSIFIIMRNNRGGYMDSGMEIVKAIKRSRAEVTTVSRGFVGSMAAILVMRGKIIEIEKDSKLLFHFPGRFDDNGNRLTTNIKMGYDTMGPFMHIFTKDQVNKMKGSGDVLLTGRQLCAILKNKIVDNVKLCKRKGFL